MGRTPSGIRWVWQDCRRSYRTRLYGPQPLLPHRPPLQWRGRAYPLRGSLERRLPFGDLHLGLIGRWQA